MAVKDNIATVDSTTTCASGFLKDYVSPLEATVVSHLRQNVCAVEGKTNMDEFGMGSHSTHSYFGFVSNMATASHRSAGGSSGGSAMTVASGPPRFCPWYRYRGGQSDCLLHILELLASSLPMVKFRVEVWYHMPTL